MNSMKPYILTLALAVCLVSLLVWAGNSDDGYHSTAGIWLGIINLPGSLFAAWIGGVWGLCLAVMTNWLLYSGVARIVLWLTRRKSK